MSDRSVVVDLGGAQVVAEVDGTLPPRRLLVALHGAMEPSRDFFLYRHVAEVVPPSGWTVVRYDRRPSREGVPLDRQAADLATVVGAVGDRFGTGPVPVALWGFSQGAWTAVLAAASLSVEFLVLVGFSAVTPSEQMRFATTQYLLAAGFGEDAVATCRDLRRAWEGYYRGELGAGDVQPLVDAARSEPWFELAYVPAELPPRSDIADPAFFDFDPIPPLARTRLPTLAIYGADDRDVPVAESIAAMGALPAGQAEVHCVPGAAHDLTTSPKGGLPTEYTTQLVDWIQRHTPPLAEEGDGRAGRLRR